MADPWGAIAESTGRLPGLALNLAQMQQQAQHMRAIEQDSATRLALEGQRVRSAELTGEATREHLVQQTRLEKQKADELADSLSLVSVPDRLNMAKITNPEEQKFFMDKFAKRGIIEPGPADPNLPMAKKKLFQDEMLKIINDPEANIEYGKVRSSSLTKQIEGLKSGEIKPDKGVEPEAQIAELTRLRELANNKVKFYQDKVAAINKDRYETVQLPDGTWASVDRMNPDKPPIPIKGTPKSVVEAQGRTATALKIAGIRASGGETSSKKERLLQSVENNARLKAGKEIALEYGSTSSPIIVVGDQVQFNPSGGNPEAVAKYNSKFSQYRAAGIKRAGLTSYAAESAAPVTTPEVAQKGAAEKYPQGPGRYRDKSTGDVIEWDGTKETVISKGKKK